MYLILDPKLKIEIKTYEKFWPKFKSLKFYLYPLDFGICYPKRRIVTTYFLCQPVDIVFTDKNNIILKMYPDTHSEKLIWKKRKTYYTYYLPEGSCQFLEVGKPLPLENK